MQRVATLLNFVVFACSLEFKTQAYVQWHLRQLALSIRILSISRDEIQFSLCAPACQSPFHPRKVFLFVCSRVHSLSRMVYVVHTCLTNQIGICRGPNGPCTPSTIKGCIAEWLVKPIPVKDLYRNNLPLVIYPRPQVIHISSISRGKIQFSLCAPGCQSPFHQRKVWRGVINILIKIGPFFNCSSALDLSS